MSTARRTSARVTLSWGLLDQIVVSGSTFLFVIISARALSSSGLGSVAFAFEVYLVSVFAARGVAGDPLTSRFSGLDRVKLRGPVRSAAAAALATGAATGLVVAVAAGFADPPLRQVLLVAAAALPGLALQDFVRSALIVQGRVRAAFCNDTLWVVSQLVAMGLVIATEPSAPALYGAWAATGCMAALVGLVQLGCGFPRPRDIRGWLRETRGLWPYYLADNLVYSLTSLLLVIVVSATSGLAATAGFRVAMTVYAPLSLIGRGVISVTVAMLARRRDDPVGVRRRALLISGGLTPLALGWGLLTLLIPAGAGVAVFGESWNFAEPLVFLASFICAAGLFATGVIIGLRALSAGRQSLIGRLTVSIGASAAAAAGGLLGDVHGVFLALALFFPVQVLIWWSLLSHATRKAVQRIGSAERLDVQ